MQKSVTQICFHSDDCVFIWLKNSWKTNSFSCITFCECTFWQGKSTHPCHNCPIYNRHPEICSKKTDFSCWHKHRLWGQNLKVSLLITCSAKFRIIPFKCHLMSTLSRKKSILSFVITLSLMVLLNRVLPLLFKCMSKIYRTHSPQIFEIQINLTQPDKWRDQILGSNLSFF